MMFSTPKNHQIIIHVLIPYLTILLLSLDSVVSKLILKPTESWENDTEYIVLESGETIRLRHDPCKETSYLGDIPLSKDEFELFFERKLTESNTTLDRSPYHHQDGTHRNVFLSKNTFSQQNPFLNQSESTDQFDFDVFNETKYLKRNLNEDFVHSESDDELPTVSSEYISDEAPPSNPPEKEHPDKDPEITKTSSWSRKRRAATAIPERLWPDGVIPYRIEGNFTGAQRAMFKKAMRHWENHTCITFVKQTVETDYIIFTRRSCGCCSYVGRKGDGSQAVSLGKNCDKFGVVVHELGHVVGFWHEHTRPDRDLYITVKYENIMEGQQYNFEKLKSDAIDSLGELYDYGSIMHYSANTFSKNNYLPTIEALKDRLTGKPRNIGQRDGLSDGDIRQTNKLYRCKLCGHSLLDSEGEFKSPGHPQRYNDDIECEWRISVTSGEKIGLNITDWDIRNPVADIDPCDYEYFEIRDGHYHKSRLIGRYCYTRPPPNYLKSSGNRLWIKFKTSRRASEPRKRRGFSAEYHSICGGTILASNGTIQSPNFPDNYKNSKECRWYIITDPDKRIGLRFISFDLEDQDECKYDYLDIHGAAGEKSNLQFCGSELPEPVRSADRQLEIIFKSDSSMNKGGFSAEFFPEVNECMENNGGCMHTCIDTVGSYKCECNIGFQLRDDGKSCESACGGYIVVDAQCNPETQLKNKDDKCIPSGTITSPNFPANYPNNKHCIWNLMAPNHYKITIEFEEFQLEGTTQCKYDYMHVKSSLTENSPPDGSFCGDEIPSAYTSESHNLQLVFHTDDSIEKKGFNLTYFVDYDECSVQNGGCQHTCRNTKGGFNCSCREGFILHEDLKSCKESECLFNLTEKPGLINTPGYPLKYPKSRECTWRITTAPGHRVSLRFLDFALENKEDCSFDYVKLSDGPDPVGGHVIGKYCGEMNTRLEDAKTSYSNIMTVHFVSDATVVARGFKAEYFIICGGRLVAQEYPQNLVSHALFGDSNYESGEKCQWIITAFDPEYYIEFNFDHIEIEWEDQCKYDSVQIFDGEINDLSARKGFFCGDKVPTSPLISTTDSLLVYFSTDDTLNKKGFSATFRARRRLDYDFTDDKSPFLYAKGDTATDEYISTS